MLEQLPQVTDALAERAKREKERRRAAGDPLYLVSQMAGVDQRSGEKFDFAHIGQPVPEGYLELDGATLRSTAPDWAWQRWLAEKLLTERRLITLKGRQIGVTWVCLAVDVAEAIQKPDTASLLYRQKEDEAIDNVRRWWRLYQSLPPHFTQHIRVLKPDPGKATQPGRDGVALQFPGGAISEIVPMTSAGSSGHGRSVRRILLDEGAYIEMLEQIMAAVEPAAGPAAIDIVSTANGRHNPETGEGNEFSRRWEEARKGVSGYFAVFFPYDIHPDRDEEWYKTAPEVQSLKPHQRHAQFPRTEHEAFTLTSRTFFEADDLAWYAEHVREPVERFDFRKRGTTSAERYVHDAGAVKVFKPPREGATYAIGADVATGRGADYSAAYVIDLGTMEICSEFHGKIDADLYAFQLHYLGKWYNTAKIAVEVGGGYGEAVIIPLRDGREGRPPYQNLYRHVLSSRSDQPVSKPYGFPTNTKTRPLVLNQFEQVVREKSLPFVTDSLLWEMESFVYHDAGTSPRALDGSRDDLVMAMAITLELYRLYGHHPDDHRRSRKRLIKSKKPLYPWKETA
jgi:hypothetical protein